MLFCTKSKLKIYDRRNIMIAGVMLRHYKNYENVNFLPISDNLECIQCTWGIMVLEKVEY